jgi:hypothetical protein
MAKEIRRFPPPWSIIEHDESFAVIDATGFNLAYLNFAEGSAASIWRASRATKPAGSPTRSRGCRRC